MNGDDQRPIPSESVAEIPAYVQSPDLLIQQMETEDIIELLEHLLRGEFKTNDGNWLQKGKILLNEEGVRMMVTIVASHLSKDKILTDLKEEDIIRMAREIRLELIHLLRMNWKKYGIEKSNLSMVVAIIDHYIFANLSRSVGGRTLDYYKPMARSTTIYKPEKERSRWGFLPFIGGKE